METDNYQLPLHNPWWDESFNIKHDIKLIELAEFKYKYEHPLLKEFPIKKDVILTLRGPRRIGKTTLVKQIIEKLIGYNILRNCIFYFPCDRVENFNELFQILQNYIEEARVGSGKRIYVFLDEISFVPEWQRAIKSLADSGFLKGVTLLITGSNSLDLRVSSERLPGRTGKYFNPDKLYLPLNFYEFYKLLNPGWDEKPHYKNNAKLKKYFNDYLLVGGFPGVINEYYEKKLILPETYATYIKWIEGDIHKFGKSLENAYKVFKEIYKSLGSKTSYTNLAKNSALASQKTAQEYIELFEMIFVIYKVGFFSLEQKKDDYKKNKKFYFLDPFIHNAILAKENGFLDDAFNYSKNVLLLKANKNSLTEEVVGASLFRVYSKLYYGNFNKENKEIDFVGYKKGNYELFEIKNTDSFKISNYKEFISNSKNYEQITIVSKNLHKKESSVNILPVHQLLTDSRFA